MLENRSKDTPALRFGRIVHKAVLEGAEFNARVRIIPDFGAMQSSKNREKRDAWIADGPEDSIIISQDESEIITQMIQNVMSHPVAGKLIEGGCKTEASGYFNHEGFRSKIRMDIFKNQEMVIDLKTCRDGSVDGFRQACRTYDYRTQAAWYLNGASSILGKPLKTFGFIALEKEPPYAVAVYAAGETFIGKGKLRIAEGVNKLRSAFDKESFFGYSEVAETVDVFPYEENDVFEMEQE
jgi:hypothetical protein